MQDVPAPSNAFSRSELEIELGKLALAIMRTAPDAFDLQPGAPAARVTHERFQQAAGALLARTRPEHRGFVIGRLRDLADSSAGLRIEGFPQAYVDAGIVQNAGEPRRPGRAGHAG